MKNSTVLHSLILPGCFEHVLHLICYSYPVLCSMVCIFVALPFAYTKSFVQSWTCHINPHYKYLSQHLSTVALCLFRFYNMPSHIKPSPGHVFPLPAAESWLPWLLADIGHVTAFQALYLSTQSIIIQSIQLFEKCSNSVVYACIRLKCKRSKCIMMMMMMMMMMIASETAGKHHKTWVGFRWRGDKQSPEQSKHALSGDKPAAIHVSCAPFKSPTTVIEWLKHHSITVQVLDAFHICKIW